MKQYVLFIHGAGEGAYQEDARLVASLQTALAPAYQVRYPRMPVEDSAAFAEWTAPIAAELATLDGPVSVVGHSVGGSVLVKYLAEAQLDTPIAGLYVLAAPFWGADAFWSWDDARLPHDVAAQLARIPRIMVYHSRDDEIVPFGHLALYAARLPHATIRAVDGRGHQWGNDLAEVAEDIMRAETT